MQPTLDQAYQMLNLVRGADTSLETLQALYGTGLLSDLLKVKNPAAIDRNAFRHLIGFCSFNAYPVTVNYDLSVEAAIRAGTYNWKNENITSANFPSMRQGVADLDIILVHYDRDMKSEEVLKDFDKQGLRPAELPELLALAAKYPDLQREFPIVALGSPWQNPGGGCRVPALCGFSGWRLLDLRWFVGRWYASVRFVAVRK